MITFKSFNLNFDGGTSCETIEDYKVTSVLLLAICVDFLTAYCIMKTILYRNKPAINDYNLTLNFMSFLPTDNLMKNSKTI